MTFSNIKKTRTQVTKNHDIFNTWIRINYKRYYEKEVIDMAINWIKLGGVALTLLGAGVSVANGVLEDKKLDDKVTEKVAEALTKSSKGDA